MTQCTVTQEYMDVTGKWISRKWCNEVKLKFEMEGIDYKDKYGVQMEFRDRPQSRLVLSVCFRISTASSTLLLQYLGSWTSTLASSQFTLCCCSHAWTAMSPLFTAALCSTSLFFKFLPVAPMYVNCCNPSMGLYIPPLSSTVVVLAPSLSSGIPGECHLTWILPWYPSVYRSIVTLTLTLTLPYVFRCVLTTPIWTVACPWTPSGLRICLYSLYLPFQISILLHYIISCLSIYPLHPYIPVLLCIVSLQLMKVYGPKRPVLLLFIYATTS